MFTNVFNFSHTYDPSDPFMRPDNINFLPGYPSIAKNATKGQHDWTIDSKLIFTYQKTNAMCREQTRRRKRSDSTAYLVSQVITSAVTKDV